MEHQEQCILEGEGVQGSGSPSENEEPSHRSDRPHFQFSSESDGQWESFLQRILQWKESLMISWQTFSVTWKIDDSHLK